MSHQKLLYIITLYIDTQKCMPKEIIWGPVGEKKYHARMAFFFSATPQVFYGAYISVLLNRKARRRLFFYLPE
jgi:hypothetical protein